VASVGIVQTRRKQEVLLHDDDCEQAWHDTHIDLAQKLLLSYSIFFWRKFRDEVFMVETSVGDGWRP